LASGLAQDWDPSANLFVRLRGLHPLIAAAAGVWLLVYGISSMSRRPDLRTAAWTMIGLLAVQLGAGVLNLVLLAPVWMQLVHLLLADLLWISLVLLWAGLLSPHKESPRF
jgi:heme A synthase